MTTAALDTQAKIKRLRTAGFVENEAEAIVRAIVESQRGLLTKDDLDITFRRLTRDLTVNIGFMLLAWVGAVVGSMSVIVNLVIPG